MKRLAPLFFLITVLLAGDQCRTNEPFPFENPDLPLDQRVQDLVTRMTLDEKIGQMMNAAPAIPRLGIPEYNWWNECLHGVARSGLATVFPQAIGLASAWDEGMQYRVANAISDEARAKYQSYIQQGKRLIYQGLTFWSPNINIFRDPRWGRGQETYGEDPYLTGRLAVQFIRGLQGNDSTYFKTIATVKHFAVHSGPEPERHSFDAQIDQEDFRATYLPQFYMGVTEGKAYSVMCAYNSVMGQACCGSSLLLTKILRDEWHFKGYVVSDCGAVADIYQHHKLVPTPAEAAALAVNSGCDLECDTTFTHLGEAVREGLITQGRIDTAVARLFRARFKLGMFDPPERVPFTRIPYSVVDSREHRELALEAARKSMVLLRNSGGVLPLRKDVRTIAVIGPNADDSAMLLGNYNGIPSRAVTPLEGIRDRVAPGTRVLYAKGCVLAEGLRDFVRVPGSALSHGGVRGLTADYFSNRDFRGSALFSSVDSVLDDNWGDGAPRSDMDDDDFGVKWAGELTPAQSGSYQLGVVTTCKVRLFLNDSLVAFTSYHFRDEYNDPRLRKSGVLTLVAGKHYRVRVEASESYGDARVRLVWSAPHADDSEALLKEALSTARQADEVILCMGLSSRLEGEEMDVDIEGFKGGDRTSLDLPKGQEDLIRAVTALGKPVVLVLLNGSALAVNWEDEHIPAILEAWYPGEEGGNAVADVLFGDYNPGGRLPVTFYKSLRDVPDFGDYAMAGRTYRFFKGPVLYPFGYGLSYTTFHFDSLAQSATRDSVFVSVRLKNTGSREGDEVAQLYVSSADGHPGAPIRFLAGFQRVHLAPGESRRLRFSVPIGAAADSGGPLQALRNSGNYRISAGGGQPGTKRSTSSNVVEGTMVF